jgi:hypothetical protein
LRNALYQFARATTRTEPWAKDSYQRKRAHGKSHSVAVRALSKTWVRILYAMWDRHCPYERSIFEASQKAHALHAA